MLKVFRKIRRKLVMEQQMKKYLIYGTGEVLLIIIGILIAFQVNNWNEHQKLRRSQGSTLLQLQQEVAKQLDEIAGDLGRTKRSINSAFMVLDLIDNYSSVPDTMGWHFYLLTIDNPTYIRNAAFESLKSKDFDLILNDSLSTLVQTFYDANLDRLIQNESAFPSIREYTNTYFQKHFKSTIGRKEKIADLPAYLNEKWEDRSKGSSWHFQSYFPIDFNHLTRDEEFRFIVNNTIKFRSATIVNLEEAKFTGERILQLIDHILKK